ncbi:MAG: chitobiase/beta-hexosaminidase C-terminal domain-containing protein [Bryobacteraceae bacterium]
MSISSALRLSALLASTALLLSATSALPPTFSPPAGIYNATQVVSMASATPGAVIHFTLNGSTPTAASPVYSHPLAISGSTVVRAIASLPAEPDSAASASFYTMQTFPSQASYQGGFTDASALTLNSPAALNGTRIRLTSAADVVAASSAFLTAQPDIQAFTSDFTVQFTDAVADGITFCIQTDPRGAATTGFAGGELGYGSITPSVGVKLDLFNSGGLASTTGRYTNGATPDQPELDMSGSGVVLDNGHPYMVHLNYQKPDLTMLVVDATDPSANYFTKFNIDIPATVGGTKAFVGFTAGTGTLTATQEILNWNYFSIPATVQFAAFTPTASIFASGFQVTGYLQTGAASNGIDPTTESVTLSVGAYTVLIPAGSFTVNSSGAFVFSGPAANANVRSFAIIPMAPGRYSFRAQVAGPNLTAQPNPITVSLRVGDDGGRASVSF